MIADTRYSGFTFTDANNLVICPRCHAEPGERCRTQKGRLALTPHGERLVELNRLHPDSRKYSTSGTPERKALLEWRKLSK